jgi:isochorismate synthase
MLGGMPVVMEEAPTVKEWQDLIAQAAGAVNMGLFEKVVLARSVVVPETALVDASVALGRLSAEVEDGVVFAFTRSGHCFLGATPERLVRLWSGKVETAALAGSVARTGIEEDDARLAAELLKDVKNRWEHEIVVRAIVQALVSAGVRVGPVAEPVVMQTAAIQHLYTPIVGESAPGMTALDLVERLHPTPATGGEPTEAALNWLREHEGLDRGWYAAPVGWIDGLGNGEFAVALRSGVLTAQRATLFAGCGIVAGSDPRKELAESETKFQPMLRAIVRRGGE